MLTAMKNDLLKIYRRVFEKLNQLTLLFINFLIPLRE